MPSCMCVWGVLCPKHRVPGCSCRCLASCSRGSGNARASIHPPLFPSSPVPVPSLQVCSTLEIEASLCCVTCVATPLLEVGKTTRWCEVQAVPYNFILGSLAKLSMAAAMTMLRVLLLTKWVENVNQLATCTAQRCTDSFVVGCVISRQLFRRLV